MSFGLKIATFCSNCSKINQRDFFWRHCNHKVFVKGLDLWFDQCSIMCLFCLFVFLSNTNTKTMTKTNAFRKQLQRAILETCDLWDIWSKWWGDMTWPTKRQLQRQIQRQRQWQRKIHLENTFKERPQSLVTFETFYQSDEGTWPDQQKDNYKYKDNDSDKDNDKYTVSLCNREDPQRATQDTCDLGDLWSEWWGNMTCLTKIQLQRQRQW